MIDPLTDDPLLEEFEQLEQDVRQRDCAHDEEVLFIGTHDDPYRLLCNRCGYQFRRRPVAGGYEDTPCEP